MEVTEGTHGFPSVRVAARLDRLRESPLTLYLKRLDRQQPRRLARRIEAEEIRRPPPQSPRPGRPRSGPKLGLRQPANWPIASEPPTPRTTPSAPPTIDSTIASVRNCIMMSPLRAPTALRMPISRVLLGH